VLADPDFQALRVCFAHFGGWEALGKRECLAQNVTPDNWGKKIYDFMVAHPNVYTDLAKHVSMFDDPADEQTYFDTMRQLLASPAIGKRILFGTDAWLLRLDMPFDEYLRKWRTAAGSAWDDITVEGPQAFLGFAPQPDKMRGNMRRFRLHASEPSPRGRRARAVAPACDRGGVLEGPRPSGLELQAVRGP
jgi:hypothetical protein